MADQIAATLLIPAQEAPYMIEPHVAEAKKPDPVHVLWTGGWDSTYRVLDLLHSTDLPIQPHYYIATRRPSSIIEIETMGRLRHMMAGRFENAQARLLTTRLYSIHDIPRSNEVKRKLNALRSLAHIGTQYETLINFSEWQALPALELSVQKSDRGTAMSALIRAHAVEIAGPGGTVSYALRDLPAESDLNILSTFGFPLLNLTKRDMLEIAKKNGFLDILEKTWFCHDPIHGKTCGLCAPCSVAMTDGMGRRLTLMARFRNRLSPIYKLLPRHRMRVF